MIMKKSNNVKNGNTKGNGCTEAIKFKKVSVTAFVCVCIVAFALVLQLMGYKKTVSQKLLTTTVKQQAHIFEDVFSKALGVLEDVSDAVENGEKEVTLFEKEEELNNDAIFESVSVKSALASLPDAQDMPEKGLFFDDDNLYMYAFAGESDVVIALVDKAELEDLADISDSYSGNASHLLFDSRSGKIVVNTASRYGFDGANIGFLKDFGFDGRYSANEMFSDISKKNTGYTVIENTNGVNFSLGYSPIELEGWYLMQLLPETVLENAALVGTAPFLMGIAALVLGALAFTVWISFSSKRMSHERMRDSYNSEIMRILLMQVAESSLASMFVYHKNDDRITVFRDREGFHPKGTEYSDALSYLEKQYGHSLQDVRRLKNALAIAGPKKSIKIEFASADDTGEAVLFEYTLCAVKNESDGKNDAVVCTVMERKAEIKQAEAISETEDSIYNTTGIEVMLQRNTWRFLWNNEDCLKKLDFGTEIRNDYDGDVEKSISPFIMSKDRHRFVSTLSRLNLVENYRNGNTDMCIRYRINTGNGVYEYRTLDIHMYRDVKTDEIKANLYARFSGKT